MFHAILRSRTARVCSLLLTAGQVMLSVPVAAQTGTRTAVPPKAQPLPAPNVRVNRTVPQVTPPPSEPVFSRIPTVEEIFRARVFGEPLVPVGGDPTPVENIALGRALLAFHRSGGTNWRPTLAAFLTDYPESPWRASLLANLGAFHAQRHAYVRALDAWERAWALAKDATDPRGRAVADFALGEWASLAVQAGDLDTADTRLALVKDRRVNGAAGVKLDQARELLALMKRERPRLVPCGVEALAVLLSLRGATVPPALLAQRGSAGGMSLVDVQTLGRGVGVPLQMIARTTAVTVPVPSIVHLRIGHYAAIVERRGDRYRLRDRPGDEPYWMPLDTLLEESSGYLLTAEGAQEDGWRAVERVEASQVRGSNNECPPGPPPNPPPPCVEGVCCLSGGGSGGGPGGGGSGGGGPNGSGGCSSGGCSFGMPAYRFQPVTASLIVSDTPAGHQPPRGRPVWLTFNYHQRASLQPQIFSMANVGPKWDFDWLRFVQEVPTDAFGRTTPHVWVSQPPGGSEAYYNPDPNGVYGARWSSLATFVRVSTDPIRYERRLPDGTVEIYALSNGAPAGQRRVFLTELVDPLGQHVQLTWDAQLRLVAITDALGQVSTIQYADPTDALKITSVTDPFGRTASLSYNAAGQLASITDVLGLRSSFAYGPNDFVQVLSTPYGQTSFRHEPSSSSASTVRFIEATDPLGGTEHLEFQWETPSLSATAPAGDVPTGFTAWNTNLDHWNTFTWDKRAWALGAGDLTKATITHWLIAAAVPSDTSFSAPVPHSVKRPLEDRVWYAYPGQSPTSPVGVGWWREPSRVGRVLEDGTSQITEATYTDRGSVLTRMDPQGRQTTYGYAGDGTTLTSVRQTTGGLNDQLATYGSFTAYQQPQTTTDAAGHSTTLTYNAAGQVLTVTNAKGETSSTVYDADGRLQSSTGPVSGATTTYTYDGYGRVRTVTDADAYTVTTDYDIFDRPIRSTYPDGTYEETTYDRLDVSTRRDRAGRITRYYYDPLRRVTAIRDPAGRVITQDWCACGSLNALIDANGNRISWERDLQGRVTRQVRADGITATTYSYGTASGRLLTMTDPKQQVTTYTYNLDDAIASTAWTNAQISTPTVSYTYDAAYGRLATMQDGIGTTTYAYHSVGQLGAGQVASVDGPLTDDTITYTYDELGQITGRAINGAANTVSWGIDALGRVTSETNLLGTFTYRYENAGGGLSSVTYPNGQSSAYSYFGNANDRRLQTIHHKYPTGSTLSKFDYTYDAAGNILTWRQQADSEAVLWEYGYDPTNQLTTAVKKASDLQQTVLQRYAYAYDQGGNRTVEQIDDQVTGATYDNLNRLVSQQPAGAIVVAGTVSEPAAVTVQSRPVTVTSENTFATTVAVASGTTALTVAATDPSGNTATRQYEVDTAGAGGAFTYDANGNLTSDGIRWFDWDARNLLVGITNGQRRVEFLYDGHRHRVKERVSINGVLISEATRVWAGIDQLEQRSAGEVTKFYANAFLTTTGAHFYTRDHLGSARDYTNSSSIVEAHYAYDPFGRATSGGESSPVIGYQSYYQSNGVLAAMYRDYLPDVGRWSNEDPIGVLGGPNAYGFVRNNPLSRVDADGLLDCKVTGLTTIAWIPQYLNKRRIVTDWDLTTVTGMPSTAGPLSVPGTVFYCLWSRLIELTERWVKIMLETSTCYDGCEVTARFRFVNGGYWEKSSVEREFKETKFYMPPPFDAFMDPEGQCRKRRPGR